MKIKIIDLLNKIASGELEDLTHIKNIEHNCEYIYHKKDCRFEFVKKGIWEDYFYKFDIDELNDEIEIIEEEKKIELPEELKLKDFDGLSCYELHEVFNNKINEIISYLKAKEEGKEK